MASQTIDKLQVEIEASAKNLASVFSQLTSNFSKLQNTINSIDTSKLTTLSKASNGVSINTSGISKAERDISNSVSKIQQSLAGLESYKNAALSGDSSSLTSFNRRVISIQSSIDVLKEKFSQLGNTNVETTAFSDLKNQSSELESNLDGLKSKMNDVLNGNTEVSNQAFQQLTDDIITTRTELDAVNTQMAEMVSNGTAYTDPFESYRDSLDGVQAKLNQVSSEVQNVKNLSPEVDTSKAKASLEELSSTIKKTASNLWELTKSGITAGIDGLKTSFSGLSTVVSGVKTGISKLTSGFSTGLSKILKYGFGIRSTYVLFRRLRTYVVDAFTELQNSGAYFETTSANVTALSNALSTLKYQFGAAFEPIFNTVAPALETLINYLVAVMNTISAFIAKLTGASTYSKAVVSTAAIADNTGSAADSAEDLNKQLQGFDELNNLSGDSGSGSGGSGSSSSDDSTVTYVEESVESSLTSFWNTLADAISSGDWWKVGSLISDELTNALNSIDWNSIYAVASDFGTNFASFLNGLISDDLFSAVGTTIANSIKTALFAALSFSEKFSWSGLGTAIASGINAFVDSDVLQLSVQTFNSWARGILDTLIAAIQNISWSGIASTIAECIGTFDASGIMGKLGTVANGIANALYTLVSNKDTWTNLGTKIGEGITSFFTSMNAIDSKTGKSGWSALGSSLSNTLTGIGDMITTALDKTDWQAVGQGIADFINGRDWTKIKFTLGNILTAIKNAIVELIKGLNLSAADVATATVSIAGIGLTILTISGISFAASITKKVLTDMIAAKIAGLLGTGTISLGSIGSAIGNVGLTIAVAVVGWKLGTLVYENATGKAAPSFSEIIGTLASDGAFGDLVNGFKLDVQGDASITIDLAKSLISWVGTPTAATLGIDVSQLDVSTKKVTIDVDTTKTDSAMTFTNQVTLDGILGSDFSSFGADIVKGVQNGASDEVSQSSGSFWTGMWNEFKQLVVGGVAAAFDMHSPAKVMYPYGENILLGIVEGFKSKFDSFSETIGSLKDSVIGWIQEKFSGFSISDYLGGWTDTNVTVSATLGTPKSTLKGWGDAFNNNITSKWVTTRADVSADLGGDLEDNGINTFSTWETVFSNFKSIWTGTSAIFKAKTGGEISNISDLGSWQTTFENLYNAWQSRDAKFTAGYGNGTSSNSIGTMKDTIKKLTDAWFGESVTFAATYASNTSANTIGNMKSTIDKLTGAWFGETAYFGATYANGTSANTIDTMKTKISNLTGAWKSPAEATFKASFDKSLETMQGYKDAITGIYDNWKGASADFTVNANVNTSNFGEIAQSLVNEINKRMSGTKTYKLTAQALGGVLTNGGWKSIPQHAGGSLNAGSLFFAGEQSGNPELVGHVNGRTEVLNKSQLASVMYASVGQAFRNFGSLASPPTLTANGYSANGITGASGKASSDALIMEQNRLLSEQNALLERIANKDSTINITDLFSALQTENNNYYNRTGNSAFVF